MNFPKEFLSIIESNQYVGIGNPNAKILFIGKEAGLPIGSKDHHGSANSWKKGNNYSLRFTPDSKENKDLRNYRHTWQKYQKLFELIENNLKIQQTKNNEYEINFVENVFTTELSNLSAPTTIEAKKLEGFREHLKKRKEEFWKSDFIKSFPIVVIAASDNNYIETYQGEICELFEVEFIKEIKCNEREKIWVHHSKKEQNKPLKLVIHTRQLTNGASNKLIEKIAELISDFVVKNSIKIKDMTINI